MIARAFLIVFGTQLFVTSTGAAEGPPVKVEEVKTPWGTVVDRGSYYLKDGEKVEHGPDEYYSDNGVLLVRTPYSHGEPEGVHQMFYDGNGTRQTETTYVDGEEHGPSRTWAPDGKLLFEGTWKNGKEWNGWFDQESTSGSGVFHNHEESWKVQQWKGGKKVPGGQKEVIVTWRDWIPGSRPDQKMFIRWPWSQFAKRGVYPFLSEMPTYADVPFLIERCAKKEAHYLHPIFPMTAPPTTSQKNLNS